MSYSVTLSLEAVEDVIRITINSQSKASVINASMQVQTALQNDPVAMGEHLSEGLYFIDREPLRAFYTIEFDKLVVEIVNVREM